MNRTAPNERPGRTLTVDKVPCLIVCADGEELYGGGKMMLRLVHGLAESEEVVPFVALTAEGRLFQSLRSNDSLRADVFTGLDLSSKSVPRYASALRGLDRFVRATRPGVAIVQNRRLLFATAPVFRRHKIPTVWQIGLGFSGVFQRGINRWAASLANTILIESEGQASAVVPSSSAKVLIVDKGVDFVDADGPRLAPPYRTAPIRVGTVASMTPRKRLDLLIEASALVRDVVAEVWIAGGARSGTEQRHKEHLVRLGERCGSPDLHWVGWTDRIQEFYRSLDIFVLCSDNEGVSGALREAMSMGLPVVARRVGGAESLVRHDETGVLIDRADPRDLAEALRMLAKDPGLRRRIGERGAHEVRQRYSVGGFVQRYERLISDIAARR